jgi:hypothetical protein
MSATLLTYAIQTNPDPLQASPQTGDPELATLMIVVSNDTHQPINCERISFGFLQGTNAKDLFSDSTGIATSAPTGWSINQDDELFTFTPDTSEDGRIGAAGLTFVLSKIKVNQQAGTTPMTITEVTASNTGTQQVSLAKFPPQFSVGPLQANPVNVAVGDSTLLSWSGSGGATYELQYEDADGNTVTITHVKGEPDQPLPSTGSYTVDNLEADPTVFTLTVVLQVNGSNSSVQVQRQVVVAVAEFTLDLEAAPTTVAPNGVMKLSWRTTQATSCILDPGNQIVPVNGHQYVIIRPDKDSQVFTLTSYGNAGLHKQAQITVSVDRTIVPTDNLSTVGVNGPGGANGVTNAGFYYDIQTPGDPGGNGIRGGDITRRCTLDTSSKPGKVWLLDASGGDGGAGGNGVLWGAVGSNGGNGGNGGDGGTITLIFDPEADSPAGYIVVSRGGKGGAGGAAAPSLHVIPGLPDDVPDSVNGSPGQNGHEGQIILKDASD